jgi:hypothetical protein
MDHGSAGIAVGLGAAAIPTLILQLPQKVIGLGAEFRALEEHLHHGFLGVIIGRYLAITPEALELRIGEEG